jgi:hypothetical protein
MIQDSLKTPCTQICIFVLIPKVEMFLDTLVAMKTGGMAYTPGKVI